jgi:alkylation response protein AidB-like acyl-CoA dehydrogenase
MDVDLDVAEPEVSVVRTSEAPPPTPVDPVTAARLLAPALAEIAEQVERDRRIPNSSISSIVESGVANMLMPKELGGAGADLADLCQAARNLAQGCTSTAWVSAFYAIHNWMLVRCDEAVREELFGSKGFVLAPAALAPSGKGRPVDGGYELSGRWQWGTGIDHADWVMLTGIAPERHDLTDVRMFILPVAEVERVDTWHTDGMRGTGSHDIVVENQFVPASRAIPAQEFMNGRSGSAQDAPFNDPRFALPLVPVFAMVAAAPALGTAEAAVAAFRNRMAERVMAFSLGDKAIDNRSQRARLGSAQLRLDAVVALFDREIAKLDDQRDHPKELNSQERARVRAAAAHVVGESRRITADVCAAAGASIHALTNPMQRYQRDLNTLCGHVMFDEDASHDLVGLSLLGMDLPPTAMI